MVSLSRRRLGILGQSIQLTRLKPIRISLIETVQAATIDFCRSRENDKQHHGIEVCPFNRTQEPEIFNKLPRLRWKGDQQAKPAQPHLNIAARQRDSGIPRRTQNLHKRENRELGHCNEADQAITAFVFQYEVGILREHRRHWHA